MALFKKIFYRKPPDGLLEIADRVYVFDCCFSTDIWEDDEYRVYIGGTVGKLRDHFVDASFMVFNFKEGEKQSQIASILSDYDMTVMEYPRQYEGCPLLTMEMIHHFLRSSESWLSLGQQNVLMMHCERGGWPILAFMLAALLIYRKQFTGEKKTLDMVFKQAPRELLQLMSPLNPLPSQLRYLQYISRRNVGSHWPPLDRALTLDCITLRVIPKLDGEGGCRPIFRIFGQDPLMVADKTSKVLFSTPKKSKLIRHHKQADCELVKIEIHCHVQGDVVIECISLDSDHEREEMMFRVMFNTAFIRSNILMLNREEIDTLWDTGDQFSKDFQAEVLFSEMDATPSLDLIDFPGLEEKDGLPIEAFAKVNEIFNSVDWQDGNIDAARNALQHLTAIQENLNAPSVSRTEIGSVVLESSPEEVKATELENKIKVTIEGEIIPSVKVSPDTNSHAEKTEFEEVEVAPETTPSVKQSSETIPVQKKDEPQRPVQPKIIDQGRPQTSLSSPSYCNSLQGSPISRYDSAPSALGIAALLQDHPTFTGEEVLRPVTVSLPSSATSSPVANAPKSVQFSSVPAPPLQPPPTPPCLLHSSNETSTTAENEPCSPPPPSSESCDSSVTQQPEAASKRIPSPPPSSESCDSSVTQQPEAASRRIPSPPPAPPPPSSESCDSSVTQQSEAASRRIPNPPPAPPPPSSESCDSSVTQQSEAASRRIPSPPPAPPPPSSESCDSSVTQQSEAASRRIPSPPPAPPPPSSESCDSSVTQQSEAASRRIPSPPPAPPPLSSESCDSSVTQQSEAASRRIPSPPPAPPPPSSESCDSSVTQQPEAASRRIPSPPPGPPPPLSIPSISGSSVSPIIRSPLSLLTAPPPPPPPPVSSGSFPSSPVKKLSPTLSVSSPSSLQPAFCTKTSPCSILKESCSSLPSPPPVPGTSPCSTLKKSCPTPPAPPPIPGISSCSTVKKSYPTPPSPPPLPGISSCSTVKNSCPTPPPPPPLPGISSCSTVKNSCPRPPPPPLPEISSCSTVKNSCPTPPPPPPLPGTSSCSTVKNSCPTPPPPLLIPGISSCSTVKNSLPTPPPPPSLPGISSCATVKNSCPTPPPPPSLPGISSATSSVSSPQSLTNLEVKHVPSSAPPPPPPSRSVLHPPTTSVPPPPPPPLSSSNSKESPKNAAISAPPPPPAPFAKGSTKPGAANAPPVPGPPSPSLLKGRSLSRSSPRSLGQAKKSNLKPYHWLKLTRAMQGSLWAEPQKPDEVSKTPEFDMSELESLFSVAAPNSDKGKEGKSDRRTSKPKLEKVQLIDLRRAYNCEIMLSKVKVPLPELMSSLLALDDTSLDADQIENLIKFCPTKEEMELLKGYTGDKEKLGNCEQFFLELMKVPRVESKLRVALFKLQFHSQVSDLRRNLNIVNSTAEEIRGSSRLKRIMQTILSLGNALNHGTARGSAVGFRLDSLLKLTDTRARNSKITLMHYLCKTIAEKLPELLDFPKDLMSLEAATKIQLKYLAEEMQAISKGLEKVVQELTASESDGPVSETFCTNLKEFLSSAESDVRSLTSLYSIVGRNADALALYFGEDPARCAFEQVVSTLLNFVRMFIGAHEANCKQLEAEKKKAAKEAAEAEKLKMGASKEGVGTEKLKVGASKEEVETEKLKMGASKEESVNLIQSPITCEEVK